MPHFESILGFFLPVSCYWHGSEWRRYCRVCVFVCGSLFLTCIGIKRILALFLRTQLFNFIRSHALCLLVSDAPIRLGLRCTHPHSNWALWPENRQTAIKPSDMVEFGCLRRKHHGYVLMIWAFNLALAFTTFPIWKSRKGYFGRSCTYIPPSNPDLKAIAYPYIEGEYFRPRGSSQAQPRLGYSFDPDYVLSDSREQIPHGYVLELTRESSVRTVQGNTIYSTAVSTLPITQNVVYGMSVGLMKVNHQLNSNWAIVSFLSLMAIQLRYKIINLREKRLKMDGGAIKGTNYTASDRRRDDAKISYVYRSQKEPL